MVVHKVACQSEEVIVLCGNCSSVSPGHPQLVKERQADDSIQQTDNNIRLAREGRNLRTSHQIPGENSVTGIGSDTSESEVQLCRSRLIKICYVL